MQYLIIIFLCVCVACNSTHKTEQENKTMIATPKPIFTKEELIGKTIFLRDCEQCHSLVEDNQKVGSPLTNLHYVETFEWFRFFIKYPQKTMELGNKRAIQQYDKYKQFMPNYNKLTDEEIKNLWLYFQAESELLPQKDSIRKSMQNIEKAELSAKERTFLEKFDRSQK